MVPPMTKPKQILSFFMMCRFLLKLASILSLLQAVYNLIKFNQLRDVFVYDFVATTKVCQGEIFELYIDRNMRYKFDAFASYKILLAFTHDSIIMH